MLPRRRFLAAGFVAAFVALAAASPARAVEHDSARVLIDTVVQDALKSFAGQTLSVEERGTRLRALILRYADVELAAQDILGRHWAKTTPEAREAFKPLLVDYVVASWRDSLSDVNPQSRIEVGASEAQEDRLLVHSTGVQPGEAPSTVDWLIGQSGPRTIVADVAVDGVSLIKTMKADFGAVLRTNAGNMDALMAAMKAKIDARK